MFGNESQLMRRRRSVVVIISAMALMAFSILLLIASSSASELNSWSPSEHNNMNFPPVAPFYWLEKKVSENSDPTVEVMHYLPGPEGNPEVFEFKGLMTKRESLNYGQTVVVELFPGDYELTMLHSKCSGIKLERGYAYKFILAPKAEDGTPLAKDEYGNLVDFFSISSNQRTEYADFDEPTSSQPTTATPAPTITEQSAGAVTTPSTSAVPAQQNTTTHIVELIGGAILLLTIVLIASKFYGKGRRASEKPTVPTTTEPAPPSPSEPTPTKEGAAIEVKRGYEVLQNNDLRFGLHIINNSDYVILDVQTILDYPKTLFSLKGTEIQMLANIHPNGERTAKYTLTPKACIHNEKIDAIIRYKDHIGEPHTVQMRPKEVHCVCPFLKEKPMHEGEFAELAAKSKHIEEGLSFSGISPSEIAAFIKESCTHRLHTVSEHEIDNTIVLNLAGESIGEEAYYLLTAVIRPYKEKDVTQIALRTYSDKPYGLRGFLNEIAGSVRHLVGSVQSAREIGIIEEKQVINIIDSVVQRTSFGGAGDGGSAEVNIKDSVMHRSDLDGGDRDSREVMGQKREL